MSAMYAPCLLHHMLERCGNIPQIGAIIMHLHGKIKDPNCSKNYLGNVGLICMQIRAGLHRVRHSYQFDTVSQQLGKW